MEAYRDQYAQLFRGGRDIVLLAISTDPPEALRSWAEDADFPFLFGSDPGSEVGKMYGAWRETRRGVIDNRTVFVIDSDGVIRWVAAPFREIDPSAYVELGTAIDRIASPQESSLD